MFWTDKLYTLSDSNKIKGFAKITEKYCDAKLKYQKINNLEERLATLEAQNTQSA